MDNTQLHVSACDTVAGTITELEKANLLAGEVMDEYFYKYDRAKKKDEFAILWEFRRNAIKTDAAWDAVRSAMKRLKDFDKQLKEGWKDE